jgi:hypothetical protein
VANPEIDNYVPPAPLPKPRYPSDREEAGKPRVRWVRVLVFEGSEAQLAWYKKQSVFQESRSMGNVICTVVSEQEVYKLQEIFPYFFLQNKEGKR